MDSVDIKKLTDEELWTYTESLALGAREATADLVDALAELDSRKLPKESVYASLHEYCVHKLLMTDGCAYRYIRAARAVAKFPPIGPALRNGRLNLHVIALIHPFLEGPDGESLVAASLGKSVAEIERMIAPRRTGFPRKDSVRLIAVASRPEPSTIDASAPTMPFEHPPSGSELPTPARFESRAELYASIPESSPVAPKAPARHAVRIAFTADESFDQLLREVQAAMRHKYPDGRLEGIFRDALKALLKKNRPWAFPKAVRAKPG